MPRDGNVGTIEPLFTSGRQPPQSIPAEQALLGAIIANNIAFHDVAGFLKPEHFADPIHARIYQEMARQIMGGHKVDAVTLVAAFDGSGVLEEVGGTPYFAQLCSAMVAITTAKEYGRTIHTAWVNRQLVNIGTETVNNALSGDIDHDAGGKVRLAADALADLTGEASPDVQMLQAGDAAQMALATADAMRRGEVTGGVCCGLEPIDRVMGEMRPSWFYVMGGRPGMGKTSLAAQMAVGAARRLKIEAETGQLFSGAGGWVVFFSLEMPPDQLAGWMACQIAELNNALLMGGEMKMHEGEAMREAVLELAQLPLLIIDAVGMSAQVMALMTRSLHAKRRVRLVMVDHLQKIVASQDPGREGMTAATSKTTASFKDLARSLKIPVLALAQLTRDVDRREDTRPQLSDLMYAGEQDADVACFLYREERYLRRQKPVKRDGETDDKFSRRYSEWNSKLARAENRADLIVAKRRQGPEGEVKLGFRGETTSFYEIGTAPASNMGPEDADGLPF